MNLDRQTQNLWQVSNLKVQICNKELLSLEQLILPKHQISCIIGPNGAGKSTLIKALMLSFSHKEQSCTGDILYQGKPVQECLSNGEIAWVGQHEQYESPLTLLEYVLLGCQSHLNWYQTVQSEDVDRAMTYLKDFELIPFAHKRIQHLSGGEKQRASIVRAFMQNTKCLMMDEPTNHLDIKHQHRLMEYLRRKAHQDKVGIILVLHDLNYAYHFCDYLIILKEGRLIKEGAPKEIMSEALLSQVYDWPIYVDEQGVRCGIGNIGLC